MRRALFALVLPLAALVSLALFGGFVTRAGNLNGNVQLLEPITFCFLIFGCLSVAP